MKIIENAYKGTINIRATMNTLEVGDTMTLTENKYKVDYVRCQASKISRTNNWSIEVSNSRELKGKIIIRRTR